MQTPLNVRLLRQLGTRAGKTVSVISGDPYIQELSRVGGLPTYASVPAFERGIQTVQPHSDDGPTGVATAGRSPAAWCRRPAAATAAARSRRRRPAPRGARGRRRARPPPPAVLRGRGPGGARAAPAAGGGALGEGHHHPDGHAADRQPDHPGQPRPHQRSPAGPPGDLGGDQRPVLAVHGDADRQAAGAGGRGDRDARVLHRPAPGRPVHGAEGHGVRHPGQPADPLLRHPGHAGVHRPRRQRPAELPAGDLAEQLRAGAGRHARGQGQRGQPTPSPSGRRTRARRRRAAVHPGCKASDLTETNPSAGHRGRRRQDQHGGQPERRQQLDRAGHLSASRPSPPR